MADYPPRPITLMGIINVGLSFLMPFCGLQFVVAPAWAYCYGDRWIEAGFAHPVLLMLVMVVFPGAVGLVNAARYYRREYRR